jgi:DNA-directed RNA polymerase subunit K/omega
MDDDSEQESEVSGHDEDDVDDIEDEEDDDEEEEDIIIPPTTTVGSKINHPKVNYDNELQCLDFKQKEHPHLQRLDEKMVSQLSVFSPETHTTLPILTRYEYAHILGARAAQLEAGSETFLKEKPAVYDCYVHAKLELEQKVLPFIIQRPLPNGSCEYWKLSDLEILFM